LILFLLIAPTISINKSFKTNFNSHISKISKLSTNANAKTNAKTNAKIHSEKKEIEFPSEIDSEYLIDDDVDGKLNLF